MLCFNTGHEWRDLRTTFRPVFSPVRLKTTCPLLGDIVVNQLCGAFEDAATANKEIELTDVGSKFSLETIASSAFGIDAQAFEKGDGSAFAKYTEGGGLRKTNLDSLRFANKVGPGLFRVLSTLTGMSIYKRDMTMFFYNTVSKTVEHRLETGQRRNDLIDIMIDVLNEEEDNNRFDASMN